MIGAMVMVLFERVMKTNSKKGFVALRMFNSMFMLKRRREGSPAPNLKPVRA